MVALELVWQDRRTVEPNEVLPEPFRWTYDHEPRLTVKSVPENVTLVSHLIAFVFMF